jgi:hypothetical protein
MSFLILSRVKIKIPAKSTGITKILLEITDWVYLRQPHLSS